MTMLLGHTPRGGPGRAQRDHLPAADDGHGQVVVLVPAHNEAAAIDATVASLHRQTRPPDRIIVVADNCTDDTEDLGLLHGAEVMATVG
jgi:cellulose synthase/poly-beta-1,6-N-acetylglucosamine synthase-like glycosyltransferase